MSLLRFTSDRGGEKPSVVYLESKQVASIRTPPENYDYGRNQSVITLNSGLTESVIEDPETVARMVQRPTGPDASAEDAR